MKLAWLTDIHLNFLDAKAREDFYQRVVDIGCDAVLITGDIAEAPSVVNLLMEMASYTRKPLYFVLGNHDYYRGEVDSVRAALSQITQTEPGFFWLPAAGIQPLDAETLLLGQDGWADARLGDVYQSHLKLNDSRFIVDLIQAETLGKSALVAKMQQLADDDAKSLQHDLADALSLQPKRLIILTHIPPFKDACFHKGKVSDDNWLPYFSAKATGDVLLAFAQMHPEIHCLVLCGHTHSEAFYQPLPNLMVKAGKAAYYHPEIQEVFTL